MSVSGLVGPWLLNPAKISLLAGVMNSWNEATADAVIAPDARKAAPSFRPIMTAGILSSNPLVRAIAIGSPATLLITSTPTAPAAFAFATFWLKVHVPRLIIASLPDAPVETLVHPLKAVSKRLSGPVGRGEKSPTAAPMVVLPPDGYVNGSPTKCWFVLAPAVITLGARPGVSRVPAPGPEFPAATATTTPASVALSSPSDNTSMRAEVKPEWLLDLGL